MLLPLDIRAEVVKNACSAHEVGRGRGVPLEDTRPAQQLAVEHDPHQAAAHRHRQLRQRLLASSAAAAPAAAAAAAAAAPAAVSSRCRRARRRRRGRCKKIVAACLDNIGEEAAEQANEALGPAPRERHVEPLGEGREVQRVEIPNQHKHHKSAGGRAEWSTERSYAGKKKPRASRTGTHRAARRVCANS